MSIQAPASGDAYLQVSQLVVMAAGANAALNKPCMSSSVYSTMSPCTNAVDGVTAQRSYPAIFHSGNPSGDWMQIDLEDEYDVTSVTYYNRLVCGCFLFHLTVNLFCVFSELVSLRVTACVVCRIAARDE